ncbi:MAG: PIN domain-containing protein [Thermoanaerobaculia bacterium]
MRYVLDTNIVAAVLNGHPAARSSFNRALSEGLLLLPAIALAELRYGALSSTRVAENLARIERILQVLVFAPIDRPTAERFGHIKARLRRSGRIKSDADLLVAATALERRARLVTDDGDLRDGLIEGLAVENWIVRP